MYSLIIDGTERIHRSAAKLILKLPKVDTANFCNPPTGNLYNIHTKESASFKKVTMRTVRNRLPLFTDKGTGCHHSLTKASKALSHEI